MADTNIFNTQLIDINSLEAFWRRIKGDIDILTGDINEVDNKLQNITTNYDGQINDLYNHINNINNKVNGINNILGSININDYYTKAEVDNKFALKTSLDNYYTKTASDDKYASKAEFDIASEEKIYLSIFGDMVIYFRDYDGTILYTYLIPELTSMPKLPTRDGLICQGWNYDIDGVYAKGYEGCDKLDIAATYVTDDGKTRLYISITATGGTDVPLYFTQTVSGGVTIDWGDGSTQQTISGTGDVNTTHKYNEIGNYVITLDPSSNCTFALGRSGITQTAGVIGGSAKSTLQKVEIGNNVASIIKYTFIDHPSLSYIVIPNGVTNIGGHAFRGCTSLSSIVIPNSVTSIGDYTFADCTSLSYIVIPNGVTNIGGEMFRQCTSLSSIVIPNSVTRIAIRAFCGCTSLSSIVIPNGVTNIDAYAFYGCIKMKYYDFSQHTTIPTLANTNAFTNIPSDCKIIVPDSLYDSWIVASNWSTYASYIIKKSDWDA